jgi:hypothetical protein
MCDSLKNPKIPLLGDSIVPDLPKKKKNNIFFVLPSPLRSAILKVVCLAATQFLIIAHSFSQLD